MNRYESVPKLGAADVRPRNQHLVRRALWICIGTVALASLASTALYFSQAGVTTKAQLPAWGVIVSLGNSGQVKASSPGRTAAAQANGVIPAKIEPSALPAAPPISLVQAATLVDKADVDLEPTPEKDRVADSLPTLSVAPVVDAKADHSTPLSLAVNADGTLPDHCQIVIRGLPASTRLSAGQADQAGDWRLAPTDLGGLTITPNGAAGVRHELTIELRGSDGRVANSVHTVLEITAPSEAADNQATPPRPAASAQDIQAWMSHGRTLERVGYLAGARLFFRRVAEAGVAEGARAMAETYDPAEFAKLGVHGMTPDAALAQKWYGRAKALEIRPGAAEAAQSP